MKNRYEFDTIDGTIVAVKKFDCNTNEEFYDCYLNNENDKYIGEIHNVNDECELEYEVNKKII